MSPVDPYANGSQDAEWFGDSAFFAEAIGNSANLTLPQLTNSSLDRAIHPLFPLQNFNCVDGPADAAVLEQPAALATRFLESGALDAFFHTLLFEKLHKWRQSADKKKQGFEYDSTSVFEDRPISQEEKVQVRTALRTLADHITWVFDDKNKQVESGALTLQGAKVRTEFHGKQCYKSNTIIHLSIYEALKKAHNSRRKDIPLLLGLRFELAVTMVHELAHAFWNTYKGLDKEPFFGNELTSEIGFELERRLFDGQVARIWQVIDSKPHRPFATGKMTKSNLAGFFILWEYPYSAIQKKYDAHNHLKAVRSGFKEPAPLDMTWAVSLNFVEKLFTDNFWDVIYPLEGMSSLHPPRKVGFTFRIDADEALYAVKSSFEEHRYVPEGYHRATTGDCPGDIVPIEPSGKLLEDVTKTQWIQEIQNAEKGIVRPWVRCGELFQGKAAGR